MSTDRRERAKSIRAARDWLTGAEHALAGEDDLAGDLKLMLARAELARIAADRRARIRRWTALILPPLAAAGILAWLIWESPPVKEPVAAAVQREEPRVETPLPLPEESAPAVQATTEPMEHPTAPPAVPQTMPERTEAVAAAPAPAQADTTLPARPQMPNVDLQRLMQVGGKILRE